VKVAYFVNQYPKVSHTFIRREIAALERQGVSVERYALRGWDAEVTDDEDVAERGRTQYVLQGGIGWLLVDALADALRHPVRMARGVRVAWEMARRSERPFPYHLVYLFEASRVARWYYPASPRGCRW
jgi:colanic acid/amylovoran biosynthesis glycosyltransferase